jgi:hypothetical protein
MADEYIRVVPDVVKDLAKETETKALLLISSQLHEMREQLNRIEKKIDEQDYKPARKLR